MLWKFKSLTAISFGGCSYGQDKHVRLLAAQDREHDKKASEMADQHKEAVIKLKAVWDKFKQDIRAINKNGKATRQKSAALEAKWHLRKTDYKDSMQDAIRLCRTNCDSHIKDMEKKVKQAKKAKSGELGEIQKLIAGLFRD